MAGEKLLGRLVTAVLDVALCRNFAAPDPCDLLSTNGPSVKGEQSGKLQEQQTPDAVQDSAAPIVEVRRS